MKTVTLSCDRCQASGKTKEEFLVLDIAEVGVTVKKFLDPGSRGQYDLMDLCGKCRAELGLNRAPVKERDKVSDVPGNLLQCLERMFEEIIKRKIHEKDS